MKTLTITKEQARRFLLAYQALWPARTLAGKSGILSYIRRVGCIQFDPLNIVGHNQELILQARIHGFRPELLQELLYQDRQLLDGWDKNMSIYLTEDWPYFRRNREGAKEYLGNSSRPVVSVLPQVRQEIEERGPLSSADLDYNQTVNWAWAPTRLARAALESMYFWGELIVHHKTRTRKFYDFSARYLPEDLLQALDPNPTEEEYQDWYLLRRIGSIGLLWNKSGDAWLGISGLKSKERGAALARLLNREEVIEVSVDGMKLPLYLRSADQHFFDTISAWEGSRTGAAILAPLDNLLWERRMVKELFGFDYVWEVYKPITERKYGYYVLPVLYGDRFVARFEPGRDRKSGALVIKNWWWEPGVIRTPEMDKDLGRCFQEFIESFGLTGINTIKGLLDGHDSQDYRMNTITGLQDEQDGTMKRMNQNGHVGHDL